MLQRASKRTPISASIELINAWNHTSNMTNRHNVAVFMFLIFLSMGRGINILLLVSVLSVVPCIKFNFIIRQQFRFHVDSGEARSRTLTEFVFKCLKCYTVTEFKDLFIQRN